MSSLPSASSPPSPAAPGLWRRKSNIGAVDAQGLSLIHPMTWLDERLFGWSPSSGRTDLYLADIQEDDVGDHDNVVGSHESSVPDKVVRSRISSYAELQRPRL